MPRRYHNFYTAVTIDRAGLSVESCWSSPLAAGKFAERRYADPRVKTVGVFHGEVPDKLPAPPIMHPDVLLYKTKPE